MEMPYNRNSSILVIVWYILENFREYCWKVIIQ